MDLKAKEPNLALVDSNDDILRRQLRTLNSSVYVTYAVKLSTLGTFVKLAAYEGARYLLALATLSTQCNAQILGVELYNSL